MTYTKENIIGVEFTVKGENQQEIYKIIRRDGERVILRWDKHSIRWPINEAIQGLNNGTWIAKNNDLTTPNKGIN